MKALLIGLMVLGSFSAFANNCQMKIPTGLSAEAKKVLIGKGYKPSTSSPSNGLELRVSNTFDSYDGTFSESCVNSWDGCVEKVRTRIGDPYELHSSSFVILENGYEVAVAKSRSEGIYRTRGEAQRNAVKKLPACRRL